MSVRRRAIHERKLRDGMRRAEYEKTMRWVGKVQDLCRRKLLFVDSTISVEELASCFDPDVVQESPAASEWRERVVRMSTERGDFVAGDDGYYVYWPKDYPGGSVAAHDLRILADHLDSLNAEWDAQVKRDLTPCVACEGSPKGDNNPCAVCGRRV